MCDGGLWRRKPAIRNPQPEMDFLSAFGNSFSQNRRLDFDALRKV
jgi:hypothetical protein